MANLKREYSTIKPIAPKASTSLFGDEEDSGAVKTKIVLRDEQKDAVEMAFDHFCKKSGRKFLWNAKMRFGKTFCALELARRMSFPEEFLTAKKLEKYHRARRTLIVTHRPVLKDSWRKDFYKIFGENPAEYQYGSRFENESEGDFYTLEKQAKNGEKNYIFFVSMQYIRLSNLVGGDSDDPLKKDILNADWDLIVVDEAHEGTQTERGKNVISYLTKENTKVLHLTGTAYNLYDNFSDSEIYTWDYVMEQQAKKRWKEEHPDEPEANNPYFKLPAMEVRTYNLGNISKAGIKDNQIFSFKEFYRTYQGMNAPKDKIGRFVHEDEVQKFLDLMCTESDDSYYPFSTEKYRDMFRHTLWVVPGVREAKALENLLKAHDIFGQFDEIINVAGKNDEDIVGERAVQEVLNKMGYDDDPAKDLSYLKTTITISCSRLTTGVTVPPWTAVFYMKGSDSTNVGTYMQTIFRVQSGWEYYEDGIRKIKEKCYVFDFAPDRALKMMAENAVNTTKYKTNKKYKEAESARDKDKENLNEQLELLPVISMDGGKMEEYKIDKLFQQLDRVLIDRIALNGFNDNALYEMSEIDSLTDEEIEELNDIGEAVAKTSNMEKPKKATKTNISHSGLSPAQKAAAAQAKQKEREGKELTEEEKAAKEAARKEKEARRKERENRISILRAISLRVPLLMYGAKVDNEDEELTLNNFTRKIDDASWIEFMPKGIDKSTFNRLKKLYNMERFNAAGRKYREWAREADEMSIEERIQRINEIFDCFHNPDKETVLTPWNVVNRHLSDTLGGWCFCNKQFNGSNQEVSYDVDGKLFDMVDTCMPRHVPRGEITDEVFHTDEDENKASRILEINSKTGKYPLYVAYSFYRNRAKDYQKAGLIEDADNIVPEDQQVIWDDVLKTNVYVLCNTRMAEYITRRTLCGFRDVKGTHIKGPKTNEPTIVHRVLTDRENLLADIKREGFWNGTTSKKEMKFNAIVSNPPYNIMDGGGKDGGASTPIYHKFVYLAKSLHSPFISFIMPAKWYSGGRGLDEFRRIMLTDEHIQSLFDIPNEHECFPNVDVPGGVCYFLRNTYFTGECQTTNIINGKYIVSNRSLSSDDVFIRYSDAITIIQKINPSKIGTFDSSVFSSNPFGFRSYFKGEDKPFEGAIKLFGSDGLSYVRLDQVNSCVEEIFKWKVVISKASAEHAGQSDKEGRKRIISRNEILSPGTINSESYLLIKTFDTEQNAIHCQKYIKTQFFRFLLSTILLTQNIARDKFKFVPLQDFTPSSDIDWSKSVAEIDQQLYDKYGLTQEERDFIESMIKPME